jgi:hypothetical protein
MMCFAGLPVATVPLWHLAQFATSPVWFMRAPANVTALLWQVSHGAVVATWFGRLPVAAAPLWQVAQPLTRPAWFGFGLSTRDDVCTFGDFDEAALDGGAVADVRVVLVEDGVAVDALDVRVVAAGVAEVVLDVAAAVPDVVAVAAGAAAVPGLAAAVVGACGVLDGSIPPLNVTVLKWQLLQGAFVTGWFGVLPAAVLLLWQLAQGPSAWT